MTDRSLFENPPIVDELLSAQELQNILSLQSVILNQAVIRTDYDALLDELCLMAESFTPDAVAAVMLYDENTRTLDVANAPSLTPEAIEAFNGLQAGDGSCGNAVYHNEPMYVCNPLDDPRWARITSVAERFGISSCFSFPILEANGRPIGSFSISSFRPRQPSGFHQALLKACTSISGVILQRREDELLRRQLLDEQIRNERIESLGVLAGGFAHDFNNLLFAIMGNVDLACSTLPSGEAKSDLELALKAIEQARGLTSQLLTASKGGSLSAAPTNIATIIKDSAEFSLHGSNVSYEITGVEQLPNPVINVDGGQIGQVFQNLVINARQSMPNGGVVRINCGLTSRHASLATNEDLQLKITVSDTGEGMSASTLEHLFEPYFTTREEGSGLGLFLSYSIVKRHGGTIEVRSEVGKGTEFAVFLPWNQVYLAKEPVEADSERELCANILIMDDDPLVRRTLSRMLSVLGCNTMEATDGHEAVECYQKCRDRGEPIDLTILDLTVPGGMGGIEAKDELRKLDPSAKLIVSSGYTADEACKNHLDAGFDAVMLKPYTFADLKRVLRSVISTSS